MKFLQQHYEALKQLIKESDIDIIATKANYKEKGLSDQRFYWDLFWASKWHKSIECRESDYLDTHIETAIKTAVKELINS